MARIGDRRRTRWNLLLVSAFIVVAVVSMLAYLALWGDQLPSEEEQPEQEEVIEEDPVLTPAGTPEDAGAPED